MPRSSVPDPALATVIRLMRERRGLTQEELAHASGSTMGTVARTELGQSVPGWDTVRMLARALDVSMVELCVAVEAEDR
jgi:transcriptional regulator with XRE-family HTH domain